MKESQASQRSFRAGGRRAARDYHDAVLSRLLKPRAFIQSSLLDDVYCIQTDDPDHCRHASVKLLMASPIAPGPELLTDDVHVHDLLTVKMCLIHSFGPQHGWLTSSKSAYPFHNALLGLVRWRNAQGITHFCDLTPEFFEQYLDALRDGGTKFLLPMEDRVAAYVQQVQNGSEQFPIKDGRLQANEIARKLGVSLRVQIHQDHWQPILDELQKQDPKAFARIPLPSRQEVDVQIRQTFSHALKPWGVLWDLREFLEHDPLQFAPWTPSETAWSFAATLSERRPQRTILPPFKQTCFLLNAALDFVQNESSLILEALSFHTDLFSDEKLGANDRNALSRRYFDDLRERLTVERAPEWLQAVREFRFASTMRGQHKENYDFRDVAFGLLAGACAIVLAGMSARRRSELNSLRRGCLYRDEHGRLFISAWAAKNLRRVDAIPAPESVERVVEVLERLSERARHHRGDDWLFNFVCPAEQAAWPRLEECIQAFVAYARLPALDDGSTWFPLPHQFRAFFAVLYYYRFHYPSLLALRRFLKQADTETTRVYLTSCVSGGRLRLADEANVARRRAAEREARRSAMNRSADFEEVRTAFIAETAHGISDGSIEVGGAGGREWKSELEELVSKCRETTRFSQTDFKAHFAQALGQWVSGKSLEPHPQGHSFCKCSRELGDLTLANCLREKANYDGIPAVENDGPDLAYAMDEVCASCAHNVTLPCNVNYWKDALIEAREASTYNVLPAQRVRAMNRAERISRHLGMSIPDVGEQDTPIGLNR